MSSERDRWEAISLTAKELARLIAEAPVHKDRPLLTETLQTTHRFCGILVERLNKLYTFSQFENPPVAPPTAEPVTTFREWVASDVLTALAGNPGNNVSSITRDAELAVRAADALIAALKGTSK